MNANSEPAHTPGSEIGIDDLLIVDRFEVYSAMVSDPAGTEAATPAVFIDLAGFSSDDLPLAPTHDRTPTRNVRVLLEVPGAEGIATGILNSLGQLKRLAKNQERP